MSRAAFDGEPGGDLFKAVLHKQQSDEIGAVVDDALERAARHRAERAERERVEREAEERARRLEHFRAMEAEDARRLWERETIEEEAVRERESDREAAERAQLVAELRRRDELFA